MPTNLTGIAPIGLTSKRTTSRSSWVHVGARGEAEKDLEDRHRDTPLVETTEELVKVELEVTVADAVVG